MKEIEKNCCLCWVPLFEHLLNWSLEDLARVYPHQVPWNTHTNTHTHSHFLLLASFFVFSSFELATTSSSVAREK